jgi:flagellar basal-body rod modification protein FlgD
MSTTNAVSGTSNVSQALTDATTSTAAKKTLGQDDFLKLLVAQLTAQDPLNPTKDTDFLAQMTQFSTLQQNQAMQADLAAMRSDQQLTQANGLIGRSVVLQTDDTHTLSGVVAGVQMQSGAPKIVVGGQSYDLSQLVSVAPATTQSP